MFMMQYIQSGGDMVKAVGAAFQTEDMNKILKRARLLQSRQIIARLLDIADGMSIPSFQDVVEAAWSEHMESKSESIRHNALELVTDLMGYRNLDLDEEKRKTRLAKLAAEIGE
jgi:hypothetical protein